MADTDAIYKRVIDLFDEESRKLGDTEYRDLVESLADEFQTRYDVIMEEIHATENGEEEITDGTKSTD